MQKLTMYTLVLSIVTRSSGVFSDGLGDCLGQKTKHHWDQKKDLKLNGMDHQD